MVQANEVGREELLLRDVGILFQELQFLRSRCDDLERENEAYRKEFDVMSNKLMIYENSPEYALKRIKIELDVEREGYIREIKSIRKKYKLTQKEFSKICYRNVTPIENRRRSMETTKNVLDFIKKLHESGELKAVAAEMELLRV
jgi:DNA-binding transcriptional regulator YiaG